MNALKNLFAQARTTLAHSSKAVAAAVGAAVAPAAVAGLHAIGVSTNNVVVERGIEVVVAGAITYFAPKNKTKVAAKSVAVAPQ